MVADHSSYFLRFLFVPVLSIKIIMAIYNLASNPSQLDIKEDLRQAKTVTSVAVTTTSSTALAANANRVTYSIHNVGAATAFFREGSTVSNSLYEYALPPGFYFTPDGSEPRYTGIISVVGAAATTLMVGEAIGA